MFKTKKILLVLAFFLLLLSPHLYAQEIRSDSLLSAVKNSSEDTNKVIYLVELSWELVFTTGDYAKTIQYAQEAVELSKKIDYKKGQAEALNVIGAAYMFQGEYEEALANYTASLEIRELMGNKKGIAAAYSNIGLVYMYQGDYTKSLKNHMASLKMEKERGDKEGIAGSYNNIGLIYEYIGDYPEALTNHLAALKINEELGDKSGIANSYNNIGSIYEIQKNYDKALENHRKALKLREELGDKRGIADSYTSIGKCFQEQGDYVQALKNQLASIKIDEEIGNKPGIATGYNNIGLIYVAQGDSSISMGNEVFALKDRYPLAFENYLASLKIREEIGDKTGIASSFMNLGAVSLKLKRYSEAKKYLNDGLQVSLEIRNKRIIRDSYNELSVLDSAQGNFGKAYEHYKMYIVYRDSLFDEEKVQKTAQMHMQYEIERDQLLEQQAEEKRKAQIARSNMQQYLVIFLIVFVVVAAVILLGRFRVPQGLAQGLNFVSLLLVFESILVFTDPYLDVFANGAPYKKLLINILMAILIFPIHRLVENRLKKKLQLK